MSANSCAREGLLASGRQMLAHFRNGQLVATYAVGFGVLFNFICTFTFVSFHLAAPPYNLSASWLGAIFVVYLVGSVLTPWTGWAVGRFGRRRFMVRVIALWVAGIALTLAPSLPLIILGLAISAGCGLICQAISTGYVTITAKAGRSSAVGPLCDELLCRRQLRRRGRRPRLDVRRLAGLRRPGGGDAAAHGGDRVLRLGPPRAGRAGRCRRSSRRERVILHSDARAAGSRAASTARIDGGVSTSTSIRVRARPRLAVARRRPAQQPLARARRRLAAERDHRAVGQAVDLCAGARAWPCRRDARRAAPRPSLGAVARCACRENSAAKRLRVLAPAFEARPVTGGERRHLVEKEQFAVAVAPHLAMAVVELEPAADPLPRGPAARAELALAVSATARRDCPSAIRARGAANSSPKGSTRFCRGIVAGQKTRWPGHVQPGHHIRSRKTRLPGRILRCRSAIIATMPHKPTGRRNIDRNQNKRPGE